MFADTARRLDQTLVDGSPLFPTPANYVSVMQLSSARYDDDSDLLLTSPTRLVKPELVNAAWMRKATTTAPACAQEDFTDVTPLPYNPGTKYSAELATACT